MSDDSGDAEADKIIRSLGQPDPTRAALEECVRAMERATQPHCDASVAGYQHIYDADCERCDSHRFLTAALEKARNALQGE